MDDFQARALGNLRKRHEDKIRENAEHIREHTGYLLARLEDGSAASASHHAAGIASDAREIVSRLAALEAIEETVGIVETTEG